MNAALRIGVVVPAGNKIHEEEFWLLKAPDVTFQFDSFALPPASADDYCDQLSAFMSGPLGRLKSWGAAAVLIGCTSASMRCACNKLQEWEAMFDGPVVTAAESAAQAFRALGLKNLAVATPYSDGGNATAESFVTGLGLDVGSIGGLDFDTSADRWTRETNLMSASEVARFALSLNSCEADGFFLPCTGLRSVEAISLLERATGKPVVSSVQAGYWAALNRLGRTDPKAGFGKLLLDWPD